MPEFDRSTPVTVALKAARAARSTSPPRNAAPSLVEVVPLDGSDASRQAAAGTSVALEGDTLSIRAPESSGWQLAPLAEALRHRAGAAGQLDRRRRPRRPTCGPSAGYAEAQVSLASGDAYVEDVTGDANLEAGQRRSDGRPGRRGAADRSSSSGDLEVGDVTGDVSAESAQRRHRPCAARRRRSGPRPRPATSRSAWSGRARPGVRSASGDVKVGVAAGTGVWLDVNTASGSTRNELTMGGDAAVRRATGSNWSCAPQAATSRIRHGAPTAA